jgi:hypothetical protein
VAKRRGHKKTKRAAEISTAVVIVLGLGAAVAGVALYNHLKPVTPAPLPPNSPVPPGLLPNPSPPAMPPSSVIGTLDQRLR